MKIDFLQRVILIHSYLYYEADRTIWNDKKYDEVSKQLVKIQLNYTEVEIRNGTQYGYAFYDFDGTTGFLLWDRLKKNDKIRIKQIANNMIEGRTK
jgi:hypothetical protein